MTLYQFDSPLFRDSFSCSAVVVVVLLLPTPLSLSSELIIHPSLNDTRKINNDPTLANHTIRTNTRSCSSRPMTRVEWLSGVNGNAHAQKRCQYWKCSNWKCQDCKHGDWQNGMALLGHRSTQTINTSPMMVPTAIPAMAPEDKPGRAVVTGVVAVGEEGIPCHLPWCITCTGSQKNGTK